MSLPAAPRDAVGPDGRPRLGRFAGLAESYDWAALAAPFRHSARWRHLHHKRWHFVGLMTDELFCGVTVIDIGWGNSAFAYAFDRVQRKVVAGFSPLGLPGVSALVGANACEPCRFRLLGERIDLEPRAPDGYLLRVRGRRFRIEAEYGGAAPRLFAVGPAAGGGAVHATQKSSALALSGFVDAGGRRYALDGGVASFDYSNGLLGRRTSWRWVSAHGREAGINLQAGYFGAAENALWLDGGIIALEAAQFELGEGGVAGPWRIRTGDGLLDLRFTPEGARRDDKQLVLASSRLSQAVGTFDGWVKPGPDAPPRRIANLAGFAEDFSARW